MRLFKILISSIIAGLCIGIGGTVFLVTFGKNTQLIGSFLFSIGLLLILVSGLHLYTGKIGYVFENKKSFLLDLLIIFVGNIAGAALAGYSLRATRNATNALNLIQNATKASNARLDDNLFSILILSIFCGILVYVAVDSYKQEKWPGSVRILMVILCIGTFVACGFEHVIANVFFYSLANVWSWSALGGVMVMTLGNSLGAFIIPLYKMLGKPKAS